MASELQSGRQQLAALRAENGALKQQKTQSGQKDKKVTEEKLAAAEVPLMSSLTSHNLTASHTVWRVHASLICLSMPYMVCGKGWHGAEGLCLWRAPGNSKGGRG